MDNYSGNREAFLFVYLSKTDEAAGLPLAEALTAGGRRCYVASAFGAKDRRALNKAAAAVLFLSGASAGELTPVVNAATKEDQPLIPVFLDDVELPAGLRLLLGSKQGILRSKYENDAGCAEALLASPVLSGLRVTGAQKRAARGLLFSAAAVALAAVALVLALTLRPAGTRAAEMNAGLAALGLSGDPAAVEEVFLYGSALREGIEPTGAQSIETKTADGAAGVYLPSLDETVGRGVLTDAADFAQLVNLRELALAANAFEDLTPLWTLEHLRSLDLSCNLAPISLKGVSSLTELEALNVAYCKIDGGLEELAQLPALQTLTVSSDYMDQTLALSAKGVRVLCPSVKCPDWESLQTWAPYEHVYELILSGNVTIPAGETLTVRKNVRFSSELGGALINRGTVELFGTWEMGMTEKNNYGAVTIRPGGLYSGGMGDSHNYGDFTVDAGGVLEVDRGEQFYLEGGTLTVDGTLRIGGGGALHWNGGNVVNNGTIETDASERVLDEMLSGRLGDIRGDGTVVTVPEASEEPPVPAPAADAVADLPNDPTDLASLDEYGMTPRERAYFDTVDYRYPNWGEGTVARPLTPYVDAETLRVSQPVGCEAYLARDMTVAGQPLWAEGFAELFIAPGATVTLSGDDWTTSLAITVLPGGTLIVDGDVMFQMAYNSSAGTVVVNGRLYGEAESYGVRWGMFGNSGTVTVNGTFAPSQLFRFAGAEETGRLDTEEVFDMTDMSAPLQFANGYRSMALFAQLLNEGNEAEMWWKH